MRRKTIHQQYDAMVKRPVGRPRKTNKYYAIYHKELGKHVAMFESKSWAENWRDGLLNPQLVTIKIVYL